MNGGIIMVYNYKDEYYKWKYWKNKEEQQLRKLKVDEKIIHKLREYDWQQFNSDRKFKRRQDVTDEIFFLIQPSYDCKEVNTVEDILNEIENESLFEYLKEQDSLLLNIISLKIKGYSIKEISSILHIPTSTIYHRIKKLKKFLDL